MKKILLFAFLLCSFSAFAQYPATPTTKQELGRQTTGDGLIYRGSGAPAYTPSNNRNAWIYYDTTNNRLYKSRLGSWSLMVQDTSAFNEIQMPYIVDDTLYLTGNVTGEPLTAYVNRVWPIAALSDTASITGENQGDVAFVTGGTAVAFRGSSYWNPFSGGGGGGSFNSFDIAGDSGSSTITDGETATIAGGYGINTAESGGTVMVTADTSELVTPYDISGLPSGTGTNQRIVVWTGTNSQGNSTQLQSAAGVTLDANLAYRITGGTTASRPTGAAGMLYYNTSNNWFDLFNGTSWFNPVRSATATGLGTSTRVGYYDTNGLLTGSADMVFNTFGGANSLRSTVIGVGVTANVNPVLFPVSTDFGIYDAAGRNLSFYSYNGSEHSNVQAGAFNFYGANFIATSGTQNTFVIAKNFAPTSGTAIHASFFIRPTINQTGGANGITRGVYVLPTLTAAADWRAIEIGSNSGFALYQSGASAKNYFAGLTGIGTTSPDRLLHPELSDAVTNAIVFPLRLTHITSGTAAAGSGAGLEFEAESAGGTNRVAGTIENPFTTATNAAEVSDLVFRTMRAGTLTESLRSLGNGTLQIGTLSGTASKIGAFTSGNIATVVTPTITTAGTTGDRTINELAGTVNIAAAGTTVTVTNSLVTANSLVFCTLRTNDTTATVKNVVPIAGSFTINLGAAATGEVSIGFFVVN